MVGFYFPQNPAQYKGAPYGVSNGYCDNLPIHEPATLPDGLFRINHTYQPIGYPFLLPSVKNTQN